MRLKDIQKTNCVVSFNDNRRLRKFLADHNISVLGGVTDDERFLCFFATSGPVTLDALLESQAEWPIYHHLDMDPEIQAVKEEPVIQKDSDLVVIFCNIVAILSVYLSKMIIDIRPMSTSNKSILMITCCFIIVTIAIIDIDHFDMLRKVNGKKVINND
jgi:hypothetical protein